MFRCIAGLVKGRLIGAKFLSEEGASTLAAIIVSFIHVEDYFGEVGCADGGREKTFLIRIEMAELLLHTS